MAEYYQKGFGDKKTVLNKQWAVVKFLFCKREQMSGFAIFVKYKHRAGKMRLEKYEQNIQKMCGNDAYQDKTKILDK